MTKVSRSKIELFTKCPRCFWLDVKKGIKRPPPAPYTINTAIDYLLKQEFDQYRAKGEPHPIMAEAGIEAVPYESPELDKWRHNFTGVQHHYKPADLFVFGAVDDIWINGNKELIVVDYKATGANEHKIHDSYPRQMEIYQWLLRQNGYEVSSTGYFVFARVNKANGFSVATETLSEGRGEREAALPFHIFVEPLNCDPGWVPETLMQMRAVLDSEVPPPPSEKCVNPGTEFEKNDAYCKYRLDAVKATTAAKTKADAPRIKKLALDRS